MNPESAYRIRGLADQIAGDSCKVATSPERRTAFYQDAEHPYIQGTTFRVLTITDKQLQEEFVSLIASRTEVQFVVNRGVITRIIRA